MSYRLTSTTNYQKVYIQLSEKESLEQSTSKPIQKYAFHYLAIETRHTQMVCCFVMVLAEVELLSLDKRLVELHWKFTVL